MNISFIWGVAVGAALMFLLLDRCESEPIQGEPISGEIVGENDIKPVETIQIKDTVYLEKLKPITRTITVTKKEIVYKEKEGRTDSVFVERVIERIDTIVEQIPKIIYRDRMAKVYKDSLIDERLKAEVEAVVFGKLAKPLKIRYTFFPEEEKRRRLFAIGAAFGVKNNPLDFDYSIGGRVQYEKYMIGYDRGLKNNDNYFSLTYMKQLSK